MQSAKELMLNGNPYLSFDKELVMERQNAKALVYEFNCLLPNDMDRRDKIIRTLFGRTGKLFHIEPSFRCDYGYNIEIGENFYANYNCVILDCAKVTIGDNVLFAPNVALYTAGHPIHHVPRNEGWEYAFPITIGNNVWVGGNVVINPGITIGDNCVIGSGSIVTKDIPPGVIAVGNPCKVVRTITEADEQYYFKSFKFK
jgi:acetyltransferase-like isoleucine patch superfamily enzyme